MATSGAKQDVKSLIECSLCCSTFQQPKCLPCIHTFCQNCLQQYVDQDETSDELPCPLCRHMFVIPPQGLTSLPNNFFIQNLIELERKSGAESEKSKVEVKCDLCLDENSGSPVALKFCQECNENLCQSCATVHGKMKATKSHALVLLSKKVNDLENESKDCPRMCEKHRSDPLRAYCLTCDVCICISCILKEHEGHKYEDIKDAVSKYLVQFDANISELGEALARGFSSAKKLKAAEEQVVKELSMNEQKIRQRCDELRKILSGFEEELLIEARMFKEKKVKEITSQLDQVEVQNVELDRFVSHLKESRKRASNCDIDGSGKELITRAKLLLKPTVTKSTPESTISLIFCPCHETSGLDFGNRKLIGELITEVRGVSQNMISWYKKYQYISPPPVLSDNLINFVRVEPQQNRGIIFLDRDNLSALNAKLLKKYKNQDTPEEIITQQSLQAELNVNNYVHLMHSLLYMEEAARQKIISSYNLKTRMQTAESIQSCKGYMKCEEGQLLAKIDLGEKLNEDSDSGTLILHSVSSVLLAKDDQEINSSDQTVYEVEIFRSEYSDSGQDYMYLKLSQQVCEDLELTDGDELNVEVQFKLERLLFTQMHYALDRLNKQVDIVFPNVTVESFRTTTNYKLSNSCMGKFNEQQRRIIDYCSRKASSRPPILVVYGPFGTGKTEMIFQTSTLLAGQNSDVRILICTHTNLAADEYVRRYLANSAVTLSFPNLKVLRIYNPERWTKTVTEDVRNFCLFTDDQRTTFRAPTLSDVNSAQIIVATLVNSLMLTELNLTDHFTHIFIDQAAEVMECQAIMPLSLVGQRTYVVVAGDHMQMSGKVYSSQAKQQNFHLSIVERLIKHYDMSGSHQQMTKILLSENYRNHPAISNLVANSFYGASENIIPRCEETLPEGLEPINFYVTSGREEQDQDSTSMYNVAEVHEVGERVKELCDKWPSTWGPFKPESILVTTPYNDQVRKIRFKLRQLGLNKVVVLRVQNVPGLEFRAVFISTVRTSEILRNKVKELQLNETGTGYVTEEQLGFLSDGKLMNSALTRAKSFLAVVGDPVVLRTVGECRRMWKIYLKSARIHPDNLTVDIIKTMCKTTVISAMLSRQ